MDRWVTAPKRVTSPAWGPQPPCKQDLDPVEKWGRSQFQSSCGVT